MSKPISFYIYISVYSILYLYLYLYLDLNLYLSIYLSLSLSLSLSLYHISLYLSLYLSYLSISLSLYIYICRYRYFEHPTTTSSRVTSPAALPWSKRCAAMGWSARSETPLRPGDLASSWSCQIQRVTFWGKIYRKPMETIVKIPQISV